MWQLVCLASRIFIITQYGDERSRQKLQPYKPKKTKYSAHNVVYWEPGLLMDLVSSRDARSVSQDGSAFGQSHFTNKALQQFSFIKQDFSISYASQNIQYGAIVEAFKALVIPALRVRT